MWLFSSFVSSMSVSWRSVDFRSIIRFHVGFLGSFFSFMLHARRCPTMLL